MPKAASDDLFVLIRSLSHGEKAYYKKYARAFTKRENPLPLKLFELLSRQKKHHEEKILQQLGRINKHHLASLKNRLQEQILKVLTDYHSDLDINIRLQQMIHRIKVLLEKKMPGSTFKILVRAKALALYNECYEELLSIYMLEEKILVAEVNAGKMKHFDREETKKRSIYADRLKNTVEYRNLLFKFHTLILTRSSEDLHERNVRIKQILKHPLLSSPEKALTFSSLGQYYFMHYACAVQLNKFNTSTYKRQKEWVTYLENNPARLIERREMYLNALSNMMNSQKRSGRIGEVDDSLKRAASFIRSLPAAMKDVNTLLRFMIVTNNFMDAQLQLPNPQKALDAWKNFKTIAGDYTIPQASLMVLYGNLFYIHFFLGQFREALSFAKKIINSDTDVRQDIQHQARIFILLAYYESGDDEQLIYLGKSARRYLLKVKALSEYDKIILNYFERKLPGLNRKEFEAKVFKQWKNELVQSRKRSLLFTDTNNASDFISWIESKIENKSFGEIVRKKYNLRNAS